MRARVFAEKTAASIAMTAVTLCALLGGNAGVSAQTQTAVEYYYAPWDHYFVTSFPAEIAALDASLENVNVGWQRTGQTFGIWPKSNALASPTCRFFTTAFAPKSTHFYTPFPDECAIVKNEPAWQFESIAFYIALADGNGLCGGGTMPLYRAYNNGMGGAPNHRYTTRLSILNQMLAAGWVFEGDGKTKVFACVPQGAPSAAEGLWFGSGTSPDPASYYVHGVVLDTGEYYFVYTDNTGVISGFLHGGSTAVSGVFRSTDRRWTEVYGTYVAGMTIDITLIVGPGDESVRTEFTAAYQPVYAQPISLATVAGSYSGLVYAPDPTVPPNSHPPIPQNFNLTVDSNGALSGVGAGCTFTGTAVPYGAVNVLDATLTFGGVGCFLDTSTFAGIAFYDASARTLYVAADNGFVFGGAK